MQIILMPCCCFSLKDKQLEGQSLSESTFPVDKVDMEKSPIIEIIHYICKSSYISVSATGVGSGCSRNTYSCIYSTNNDLAT